MNSFIPRYVFTVGPPHAVLFSSIVQASNGQIADLAALTDGLQKIGQRLGEWPA